MCSYLSAPMHVLAQNHVAQNLSLWVSARLELALSGGVIRVQRPEVSWNGTADLSCDASNVVLVHPKYDMGMEGATFLHLIANDVVQHTPSNPGTAKNVVLHEVLNALVEKDGCLYRRILQGSRQT